MDRFGVTRYRVRITVDGVRKSIGLFDDPERAGRAYAGAVDQLGSERRGVTLAAWGVKWLERRETDGLHRSAAQDKARWRTHIATAAFAPFPLRRIQRIDVVRWIAALVRTDAQRAKTTGRGAARATTTRSLERKLSTQTIRNALGLLRRALGDAADEGLVAQERRARRPRAPGARRGATRDGPTSPSPRSRRSFASSSPTRSARSSRSRSSPASAPASSGASAGPTWSSPATAPNSSSATATTARRRAAASATSRSSARPARRSRRGTKAKIVARRPPRARPFPAELGEDGRLAGCHTVGYEAGWGRREEARRHHPARPVSRPPPHVRVPPDDGDVGPRMAPRGGPRVSRPPIDHHHRALRPSRPGAPPRRAGGDGRG